MEWDSLQLSSQHPQLSANYVGTIETTGRKVLGIQFILAHEQQNTRQRLFYCADEIRNRVIRKTASFRIWLPPGGMNLPHSTLLRAGILAFGLVVFGFPCQLAVLGQALNWAGREDYLTGTLC